MASPATKDTTWVITESPNLDSTKEVTLSTSGKYVDRDIKISIPSAKSVTGTGTCSVTGGVVSATAGTASASATAGTTSQTGMDAGISSTATAYYVTATGGSANASATGGSASITAVKDAHTAGYIPQKDATTVIAGDSKTGASDSKTANGTSSTIYLKAATCSVTGGTVSASATKGTASTSVNGMKTTSTNTGYSVTASATGGNASASITDVKDAHTAGYLPAKTAATVITGSSKSATGDNASETKYIVKSTISNTATSGETYADSRTGSDEIIIPSGGALYINEGYIKNTKITLDEMLGGKADTAAISDDHVAQGYVVYDENGVKHTGTMEDNVCTHTGGGLTKGTASGGGLSGGGLTAGNGSAGIAKLAADSTSYGATNVNANLLGTITDGTASSEPSSFTSGHFIAFDVTGSGSVTRAAVTRAAFSQTVTLADLTCSHSGGYQDQIDETITGSSQTVSLAADSTTLGATSKSSNTAHKYAYIKVTDATTGNVTKSTASTAIPIITGAGYTDTFKISAITVPKDSPLTVTTTADTALDSTSNLAITNNAYRQVAVTNNANGDVNVTNSGQTDITSGSSTAGNVTVNAYNSASTPALTGAVPIVENGQWKHTTVSAAGTYYGEVQVGGGSASVSARAAGNTAPTVTLTHQKSGINISESATGYYCTVSAEKAAGVVGYTLTKNAGYIAGGTSNSTLATAEPSVTGTGTIYFATSAITRSVSAALVGSTTAQSGYNSPVTVSANTNTPQLQMTGSVSGVTVGNVISSVGSDAKKYINYYTGDYSVATV